MPQKGAYGTLLYAISEVRDQLEQWVEELKEPLNILRALSISEHPSIRNRAQSKIESTQAEME